MSNLARQEMYFGRFFTLDELVESIEAVTADDVQRIAQTFFDPKQIALTVLGNLENFRIGARRPGVLGRLHRPAVCPAEASPRRENTRGSKTCPFGKAA